MAPAAFDAVIIGAGHNSLACALHLCANGWRVLVLEQAAAPGGAVKTGEYTLPGFRHDWAAMNLSLFAGSPFFRAYGPELTKAGLAFAPAQDCFASVFDDGSWLGVSRAPALNAARVRALSAHDAARWEALGADFPASAETLFALLGSKPKISSFASIFWRVFRKRKAAGTMELARFLMASPRDWLEDNFESPKLRAMLGAWGMHLDFAPDVSGGALFPYLEAMANQAFGMVIGAGGADTIIKAMSARITARGGVIRCGARVARIIVEGGRAVGVELDTGERIHAAKAVIANVAPGALARLTGATPDHGYDAALKRFRHAPGTMMIHLALDGPLEWRADPELQKFAYVHIAPSLDMMARVYQEAQAGLLPQEPILVVGQPTAIDPARAPEGKHILWIQARMAPGEIKGDAAGVIAARDWTDAAEPFAERALDIVARHAPNLRARVIGRRVVTPVELEADNPNLVGGDQICGSHHLTQHFLFRPAYGRADGSTPIAALHHVGAAVWPGAGTGAGSGYLLGQKLAGA